MRRSSPSAVLSALLLLSACTTSTTPPAATTVTIQPKLSSIQTLVFKPTCAAAGCHNAASPGATTLALDTTDTYAQLVNVKSDDTTGGFAKRVVPGDPEKSLLYKALLAKTGVTFRMPVGGPYLSQDKVDAIKAWIANGAPND